MYIMQLLRRISDSKLFKRDSWQGCLSKSCLGAPYVLELALFKRLLAVDKLSALVVLSFMTSVDSVSFYTATVNK